MVQAVSSTVARESRVARSLDGEGFKDFHFFRTPFIGPLKFAGEISYTDDNPQGYLIEQVPASFNPTHFHQVDQYQVFVQGGGKLGRHDAKPFMLHYTDRYTAYGPIVAGDAGLTYFTLRAQSDPGARPVAVFRDLLKPSKRRTINGFVPLEGAPDLATVDAPTTADCFAPTEDGVRATITRLGPGQRAGGADPSTGGGQYFIVLRGALVRDGVALPELSCTYVYAHDPALELVAGPVGAEVLMTQFPRKAA